MKRGRRLFECSNSALSQVRQEKQGSDKRKKEGSGDDIYGDEMPPAMRPRKDCNPGVAQKIHEPDKIMDIESEECSRCRGRGFDRVADRSLHQVFAVVLQTIEKHSRTWACTFDTFGRCVRLGGGLEVRAGIGTGLVVAIAFFTALAISRRKIQVFFRNAVGSVILPRDLRKCLDSNPVATQPYYCAIARESWRVRIDYIDETTSRFFGRAGRKMRWLLAGAFFTLCIFMIVASRLFRTFAWLIGVWAGILVQNCCAIYLEWVGVARKNHLAHPIRKAKRFAMAPASETARGGLWMPAELRCLVKYNLSTKGRHAVWRDRFLRCDRKCLDFEGGQGTCTRHLLCEADSIFAFFGDECVDPTNNLAERANRFMTNFGATSLYGQDDISRLLTLDVSCRLNGGTTYAEEKFTS